MAKNDAEGRLVRLAHALERKARLLVGIVRWMTIGSAGVAVWLWAVVFMPATLEAWRVVLAGGALIVLLGPAAILGVFYWGLYDMMKLPERLADQVSQSLQGKTRNGGKGSTGRVTVGILGRLQALLRQIWQLRTLLVEGRALLIRYGAMVRLVTPFFVLLVIGAIVVSLLMVPVALLATLLVLLW